MVMQYACDCHCQCQRFELINEGILLFAQINGKMKPLHFYTDNNGQPNLQEITNYDINVTQCSSTLNYTQHNSSSFTVNCTVLNSVGPIPYEVIIDNDEYTNAIELSWYQYSHAELEYCDRWALDDVVFAMVYNGTERIIFNNSFNSNSMAWTVTEGIKISTDSIECSNDRGECLYITSAKSGYRKVTTPVHEITLVSATRLQTPSTSNQRECLIEGVHKM